MLAKTNWFTPQDEVHIDEALGLLSTIKWVRDLQIDLVDFEFDSKVVVDTFHSQNLVNVEFEDNIKYFKSMYISFHVNSSVEFYKRQRNEIDQALAKAVTSQSCFYMFELKYLIILIHYYQWNKINIF